MDISLKDREKIAEALGVLLATSYTLSLQSHYFHWNVTGPRFQELHVLFEAHYTDLLAAVDEIAERIRALDFPAPGTYRQFADLSLIEEAVAVPSADEMVSVLERGHGAVVAACRQVLAVASAGADESTLALVSDRMRIHEKTAWILRSMAA